MDTPVTRPMIPAECRREALVHAIYPVVAVEMAFNPPHWPRWMLLLFGAVALYVAVMSTRAVLSWLILSIKMGQTVTYRLRVSGLVNWQRTVTYPVPQVSARAQDALLPTPFSTLIALGLTVLTGAWLSMTVGLVTQAGFPLVGNIVLCLVALLLVAYCVYCWRRVVQDRRTLRQARQHSNAS